MPLFVIYTYVHLEIWLPIENQKLRKWPVYNFEPLSWLQNQINWVHTSSEAILLYCKIISAHINHFRNEYLRCL